MPKPITAGTGMDAFAHCLEAYCSPFYHPMGQGIALEGMRLVHENLCRAYADGGDLEARGHMMAAASMGATAFQKGLGAIHALSHPVGAVFDTHHGTTNACVMPYVLDMNRPAVEERLTQAAAYLGIEGGYRGLSRARAGAARDPGHPQDAERHGRHRRPPRRPHHHGSGRPHSRRQPSAHDSEEHAEAVGGVFLGFRDRRVCATYVATSASIRRARASKSSGHFRRIAEMRRAASSAECHHNHRLGQSAMPRSVARTSK